MAITLPNNSPFLAQARSLKAGIIASDREQEKIAGEMGIETI